MDEVENYKVSEKLQCLVFDLLQAKHQSRNLTSCQQALRIVNNLCEVNYFSQRFTHIEQTIKIQNVSSPALVCFINKAKIRKIVSSHSPSPAISLHVSRLDENDEMGKFELRESINLNLCKDDFVISLSPALFFQDYSVVVAYTNQEEYHLIVVKADRKESHNYLQAYAIKKNQAPSGLFGWFKSKPPASKAARRAFIYPVRMDESSVFRLIVVRDDEIQINVVQVDYQEQMQQQFILKKTATLNLPFERSSTIIHCLLDTPTEDQPKSINLFIVIRLSENICLYRLTLCLIEDKFDHQLIKSFDCSSTNFELSLCQSNLYCKFTLHKSVIYKFEKELLNHYNESEISQIRPFHILQEECALSGDTNQLFLLSPTFVSCLQEMETGDESIPYEVRDYNKFKEIMIRTDTKKVVRTLNNFNIDQLIDLLRVRQEKLEDKFKSKLKPSIDQEVKDELKNQFLADRAIIECIILVLENDLFSEIRSKHRDEKKSFNDQNLLFQVIKKLSHDQLWKLLEQFQDNPRFYVSFTQIVTELMNQNQLVPFVKRMFKDKTSEMLENIMNGVQAANKDDFKIVFEATVDIVDLKQQYLDYLIAQGQFQFVYHLSLSHSLKQPFIQVFCCHEYQNVSAQDLKYMVQFSLGQHMLQSFCRDLLSECRKAQKKQPSFMLNRAKILLEGFLDEYDFIDPILNDYFPGLCFLFAGLKKRLSHKTDHIIYLARQCKQIQSAYIMISSVFKNESPEVCSVRLCKELSYPFLTPAQLIEELMNMKHKEKSIGKSVWTQFKRAVGLTQEKAKMMQSNMKLV